MWFQGQYRRCQCCGVVLLDRSRHASSPTPEAGRVSWSPTPGSPKQDARKSGRQQARLAAPRSQVWRRSPDSAVEPSPLPNRMPAEAMDIYEVTRAKRPFMCGVRWGPADWPAKPHLGHQPLSAATSRRCVPIRGRLTCVSRTPVSPSRWMSSSVAVIVAPDGPLDSQMGIAGEDVLDVLARVQFEASPGG